MAESAEVRGVEQLVTLAANLKKAQPELRKQLGRRIRAAGVETSKDIKAGVLATFPQRGGLANLAAATPISIRTRMTGKSAGVRLQANPRRGGVTKRTLQSMEKSGTWRHPAWGNRKAWVSQTDSGTDDWFSEPAEKDKPKIQTEVLKALDDVARQIVRGV